jgi:hypothetical protein
MKIKAGALIAPALDVVHFLISGEARKKTAPHHKKIKKV